MKRLTVVVFCLAAISFAQQPPSKNPVLDAVRQQLQTRARNMVAAAEEMPEDKYDYKPTPAQMSFRQLLMHVATSNVQLCTTISGRAAPGANLSLRDDDPKAKYVSELRNTFTFCSNALANVTDSSLADEVKMGSRTTTKAQALVYLISDWADHYGGEATYLRLNGILPPTAKKETK